jgi:hypothetical protein
MIPYSSSEAWVKVHYITQTYTIFSTAIAVSNLAQGRHYTEEDTLVE